MQFSLVAVSAKRHFVCQKKMNAFFVLVVFVIFSHTGKTDVPVVRPVDGNQQTAITPNTYTLSFIVTPPVPPENVTWFFMNVLQLQPNVIIQNQFKIFSGDKLNLTLLVPTPSEEGTFTLNATNANGTGTGSISLNLRSEPAFRSLPDSQKKHENENVTFVCFATGDPTPTIDWIFNDTIIVNTANTDKYRLGQFGEPDFGSLTIYNLEYSDNGFYICRATNTYASRNSSEAQLEVQVLPVITSQPLSVYLTAGGVFYLTCKVKGFPRVAISWQKNEENITSMTDAVVTYAQSVLYNDSILEAIGTLQLNGPVLSTNGNYTCTASNVLKTFEQTTSNIAQIFVQYPPSTSVSASIVRVNQTFSTNFSCQSFGIPPPTLRWYSNGAVVMSDNFITISNSSYINGSENLIQTIVLTLMDSNRSLHESNYTCVGFNGISNYISSVENMTTELLVQVPPHLQYQGNNSTLGIVDSSITLVFAILDASPDVMPSNVNWQFSNNGVSTDINGSQHYQFSGSRRNLTINNLQHEDEGQYTITVSNEAGIDTLSVNLQIEAAPVIIIPPMSENVLNGLNAVLNCTTTGEPQPSIQWYMGNNTLINQSSKYSELTSANASNREYKSTLTILNTTLNDSSDYSCVATNIHGQVIRTAHVEVQVPPFITASPMDTIGIVGGSVVLECEAFGSPIPNITWSNGSDIIDPATNSYVEIQSSITNFVQMSSLKISSLSFFDAGLYTCLSENRLVQLTTTNSSALLTVNQSPLFQQLRALNTINQSQTVNMTCTFFGLPTPSVNWTRFDNTNLAMFPNKFTIFKTVTKPISGGMLVDSTLQVTDVDETDTGTYTCTAFNHVYGSLTDTNITQHTFSVTVQTSPIVTRISASTEIGVVTRNITLTFQVSRDVPAVNIVQWFLNGTEIDGSSGYHNFSSSKQSFSLTIFNLTLNDEGIYTFNASNIIGTGSNSLFLDVEMAPVIISSSTIVDVELGKNANITCEAVSEPVHITNWSFGNVFLTNSSKYLITGNGTVSNTLTIFNVSVQDGGNYRCLVNNVHGDNVAVSDLRVQVPPKITSDPSTQNVLVNNNVTLRCCTTGQPTPFIYWLKNNKTITVINTKFAIMSQVINEQNCSELTIREANFTDRGDYRCQAVNYLATRLSVDSQTSQLTVQYPPNVMSSQFEYVRNQSDSFSVECRAFGVPSPVIYWLPGPFNITSIIGGNRFLLPSEIHTLRSNLANFNGSRYFNLSNQCSVNTNGLSGACSLSNITNDCSITGSLCSVPCGVSVTTTSETDDIGRPIVVSTLTLCSIQKSDELSYTCLAINNITNNIQTHEGVSVVLRVQVVPLVTSTTQTQVAFRGHNTTLKFNITEASPDVISEDIDWTFTGERFYGREDIISDNDTRYSFSADRRSLTIFNLTTNDAGEYRLTAKNAAGSNYDALRLDVQALPEIIHFTSGPVIRYAGSNVTLRCFADGSPLQNVTWLFTNRSDVKVFFINYVVDNYTNRTIYNNLTNEMDMADIAAHYLISGNTDPRQQEYGQLNITNITAYQAGSYLCTLANIYGIESRSVEVKVQLNVSIEVDPQSVTCIAGRQCNISCTVIGVPSPSVSWYQNNISVTEIYNISNVSSYDRTISLLLISNVDLIHNGKYHCTGTNSLVATASASSSPAELTVNYPPTVQVPLVHTIVNETFTATFQCVIAGYPKPSISWYRDGVLIEQSDKYNISTYETLSSEGLFNISSTLMILNAIKDDERSYNCTGSNGVSNYIGAINSVSAPLVVQVPPTVSVLSLINETRKGKDLTIEFKIARSSPSVSLDNIEWLFTSIESGAVEIVLNTTCATPNNTDSACYSNNTCNITKYQRYNFSDDLQTLIIRNVQVSDAGQYRLKATNPAGTHYADYRLTVHVPAELNISMGEIISVAEGSNITISCTADGIPRPGIVWFYKSTTISAKPRTDIQVNADSAFRCDVGLDPKQNAFTSVLTITSVEAEADAGSYTCQASNALGTVRLSQPFNLNITRNIRNYCESSPCKNGGTCFSTETGYICSCASDDKIIYGGQNCTIPTNVPVAPTLITEPRSQEVKLFARVTLTCESEGQPDPVITWFKDGNLIPDFAETVISEYPINEIQLFQRGYYHCEARNAEGAATSRRVLVNIIDVVEYSANLTIPISSISGNLTEGARDTVDIINSRIAGSRVGSNSTFFFIEVVGIPLNNTPDVIVPIRLTIRLRGEDDTANDELRAIVEEQVKNFGYRLTINANQSIILFNLCGSEETVIPSPDGDSNLAIRIQWPITRIGLSSVNVTCPCEFNLSSTSLIATRQCMGEFQETGAYWGVPNVTACNFTVTTRRLCRLATLNSSAEIINGLDDITNSTENIDSAATAVASVAIESIENDAIENSTLARTSVSIFDNMMDVSIDTLRVSEELSGSSVRFRNSLFNIVDSLPNSTFILQSNIVIVTRNSTTPETQTYSGQGFSNNISPVNVTVPPQLRNRSSSTVVLASSGFFISRNQNLKVQTSVVDFTASGVNVLNSPLSFVFEANTTDTNNNGYSPDGRILCMSWDVNARTWTPRGIITKIGVNNITCGSNHNTSFAILLDVSAHEPRTAPEDEAFEYISYIGLTLSGICLIVTLITYIGSPKLRRSEASQLLINLCFALLGLYLTFFFATFGSALTPPLCGIVGALNQYFFLVVFFIMAAESIDLFIKLVIVLGPKIQRFILKAILISWIVPLFIVLFCFAPNYEHYIHDHVCGPSEIPRYIGIIVPFGIIYIFNWTIFFIIMISLLRKSANNKFNEAKKRNRKAEVKQQCRVAFTVSVLFGLGWGFGLFTTQSIQVDVIRIISNSLFTLFVTFQGVIIFTLYVALSPNARNLWRKWILRKEEKGTESTSSAGPSTTRSTKQTSVHKSNHRGRQKGTLYRNVYSTNSPSKTSEYVSTEPELTSDFNSSQPVIEELKQQLKFRHMESEDDDVHHAFMNPLDDLGDITSLLSDDHSVHEVTFTFPNPEPSIHSLDDDDDDEEQESDHKESQECSTFANPFLSRASFISHQKPVETEEMQLLSQISANADEHHNGHIALTIESSVNEGSSLSYSQLSPSVNNDDTSLIKSR